MISIDKKKEIYNLWFIKRLTQRKISHQLGISRGTVSKIIKRYQKKMYELNLDADADLSEYINMIDVSSTIHRKRKPYKLNEDTLCTIEELVIHNEKLNRIGSIDALNIKELFEHFQSLHKEKSNIITDFSLDYFYKIVRKIKSNIHENGL
ncbi:MULTISPECIES: sigma factor-like helix-turn-helix DNA-binding protein [Bacillus]|uniref:sigma factor-like helix-turn-helix DNA-binding protein n=1 Tax=Bacillus TaxID=1386 RepID=UPI0030F64E64